MTCGHRLISWARGLAGQLKQVARVDEGGAPLDAVLPCVSIVLDRHQSTAALHHHQHTRNALPQNDNRTNRNTSFNTYSPRVQGWLNVLQGYPASLKAALTASGFSLSAARRFPTQLVCSHAAAQLFPGGPKVQPFLPSSLPRVLSVRA